MTLNHPKIKNWKQALDQAEAWKLNDFTVVFSNGCFDILHAGHVDLLARARAEGDRLVLGLNSDASVRRLNKSPERPINPQDQRAFVLAHLENVDMIVLFEQDTPFELIKQLMPNVLVKGGDWSVDSIVGASLVQEAGGKVLSLPLLEDFSTTAIVEKLRIFLS